MVRVPVFLVSCAFACVGTECAVLDFLSNMVVVVLVTACSAVLGMLGGKVEGFVGVAEVGVVEECSVVIGRVCRNCSVFLVFSIEVISVTTDVVVACCRVVAFSRVGVVVDNVAESVSFVRTRTRTCVTFSFGGSPPSRAVICKMYSFLTCNGRSN